jgi:hypothetical protein
MAFENFVNGCPARQWFVVEGVERLPQICWLASAAANARSSTIAAPRSGLWNVPAMGVGCHSKGKSSKSS